MTYFDLVQSPRRSRGKEAGFTLVEMLVVITIIGLIMALVAPRVLGYLSESKVKAAKIQIESFGSALDLFYLDSGRYPTGSEGLVVLISETRQCARLERPLPERRRRSSGSLGQRLRLPRARPTRRLRNSFIWGGRAGRWNGYRKRYYELDPVKTAARPDLP